VFVPVLLLFVLLQDKPAAKPEAQQKPAQKPDVVVVDPTVPPSQEQEQAPPKEYFLDVVKAEKEIEVGNFHMKRHNWNAAATRFEEATRWNPKSAEAWLRLGEAREKTGETTKALEAYRKYLELLPHGKKARDVQKAISRLERDLKQ